MVVFEALVMASSALCTEMRAHQCASVFITSGGWVELVLWQKWVKIPALPS